MNLSDPDVQNYIVNEIIELAGLIVSKGPKGPIISQDAATIAAAIIVGAAAGNPQR